MEIKYRIFDALSFHHSVSIMHAVDFSYTLLTIFTVLMAVKDDKTFLLL